MSGFGVRGFVRSVVALGICLVLCQCAPRYDEKEAERYIRECESQWADSVATGETKNVERFLADDFRGVDTKGKLYDKAEQIADTREGPKHFKSNRLNEAKIRFYGTTAIVQGNESWERHNGQRGRFVWTDTWLYRNGKWQIVAAEDLAVAEPAASPAP